MSKKRILVGIIVSDKITEETIIQKLHNIGATRPWWADKIYTPASVSHFYFLHRYALKIQKELPTVKIRYSTFQDGTEKPLKY